MKLFQLNILGGRYLENIIDYVKKTDIDILQFQEVSGGNWNDNIDTFSIMKERLGYEGIISKRWNIRNEPRTYFGNATFFKPTIKIEGEKVIWMKPDRIFERKPSVRFETLPMNALDVAFFIDNKKLNGINTHLVWGPRPFDEPYKQEQHKVLVEYMKTVNIPWILSGDFNVIADTMVIRSLDAIGRNLASEIDYPNTLNPRTHKAKQLFPPGLAVDYVYVSRDLDVKSFQLIDAPDLSDHFGYLLEFNL